MNQTAPRARPGSQRSFYRSAIPPALGLLLAAPVALVFVSVAAVVLVGGTALALAVPYLRRRQSRADDHADCIELKPDQYTRVDDTARVPRR